MCCNPIVLVPAFLIALGGSGAAAAAPDLIGAYTNGGELQARNTVHAPAFPCIYTSSSGLSWSENLAWVKNGDTMNVTVTVENVCNVSVSIDISVSETTGAGWLGTSVTTLYVPAGVPNTAMFDIIVDASGLPKSAGSSSWLDGEVTLTYDAYGSETLSIPLHVLAADSVEPVNYDTAATSIAWDSGKGVSAAGDNTALAVSNFGELGARGMAGPMQANLDFSLDGGECRTDDRGKFYLWSGSPYIIQHDGGGANMRISTSCYLGDQREEYSFDPLVSAPGLGGGVAVGGIYDSTYTGAFANSDTTVVLERTFFAPRNKPDNPSFMVCKTVMYSGDGQAHDNITVGSFIDWDIPSVVYANNSVGVSPPASSAGQFVYAQGSDVDTSDANLICQPNVNRYGTELFLDWHTNAEYNIDPCAANSTSWGAWGASQSISDLVGDGPDVQEWYDSISAKEGYHDNDSTFDQSIWVTYLFDHSIGANDTLTFYTLFATLHNGSLENFESNLVDARSWYLDNIRGSACATCCTGSGMGNVDCEGIVDIGDVTELIALLFIRVGDPYCCEAEADLDYNEEIDIGDLTLLTNRLFITVTDPPPCP